MIHPKKYFHDQQFSKLATTRWQNISVIYDIDNLIQQSRWSRTFDLYTTYIKLFKPPRDTQQIISIARELNNAQFFKRNFWAGNQRETLVNY